ncbi:MAG: DUF5720 family protein [Defluviitaleaceae bacterium]|nr:DUF5720 family protein [Defluviitaleaceae bacterium]
MSIKDQLQQPSQRKPITGHGYMDVMRFAKDTRHMIVFDVLTWNSPVGGKGERVRIFLSDEGYSQSQESEGRGDIKIIRRARVRNGDILYSAPEHEEH